MDPKMGLSSLPLPAKELDMPPSGMEPGKTQHTVVCNGAAVAAPAIGDHLGVESAEGFVLLANGSTNPDTCEGCPCRPSSSTGPPLKDADPGLCRAINAQTQLGTAPPARPSQQEPPFAHGADRITGPRTPSVQSGNTAASTVATVPGRPGGRSQANHCKTYNRQETGDYSMVCCVLTLWVLLSTVLIQGWFYLYPIKEPPAAPSLALPTLELWGHQQVNLGARPGRIGVCHEAQRVASQKEDSRLANELGDGVNHPKGEPGQPAQWKSDLKELWEGRIRSELEATALTMDRFWDWVAHVEDDPATHGGSPGVWIGANATATATAGDPADLLEGARTWLSSMLGGSGQGVGGHHDVAGTHGPARTAAAAVEALWRHASETSGRMGASLNWALRASEQAANAAPIDDETVTGGVTGKVAQLTAKVEALSDGMRALSDGIKARDELNGALWEELQQLHAALSMETQETLLKLKQPPGTADLQHKDAKADLSPLEQHKGWLVKHLAQQHGAKKVDLTKIIVYLLGIAVGLVLALYMTLALVAYQLRVRD